MDEQQILEILAKATISTQEAKSIMPSYIELILLTIQCGLATACFRLYSMVKDLHDWHNVRDDDGVKVWYVKKSLVEAMQSVDGAIQRMDNRDEKQSEIMENLSASLNKFAAVMVKFEYILDHPRYNESAGGD